MSQHSPVWERGQFYALRWKFHKKKEAAVDPFGMMRKYGVAASRPGRGFVSSEWSAQAQKRTRGTLLYPSLKKELLPRPDPGGALNAAEAAYFEGRPGWDLIVFFGFVEPAQSSADSGSSQCMESTSIGDGSRSCCSYERYDESNGRWSGTLGAFGTNGVAVYAIPAERVEGAVSREGMQRNDLCLTIIRQIWLRINSQGFI